jgi:hypothetical protein
VADVRMYVHSDDADGDGKGDGPLTAAQIYKIARSEAPSSFRDNTCLSYTSNLLEDQMWFKDFLGHDCTVYACLAVHFPTETVAGTGTVL